MESVSGWQCTGCGSTEIWEKSRYRTSPELLKADSANPCCNTVDCYGSMVRLVDFSYLPTDSSVRKDIPLARGVLDYFPAALAELAKLSKAGNDKHNPGEDLHWARGKSMDHADCIMRHLVDRGKIDTDGITHSAKVAWRALALLQEELEAAGAPMARGAR